MCEKESSLCSNSRLRRESSLATIRTDDDGSIVDELLLLPSRNKPVTHVPFVLTPYNADNSLGFSFPPIETEAQLLEKIRLQGYQVELNVGASLRRNLFVRRKEWLEVTSRLTTILPPEEEMLEKPILPALKPRISTTVLEQPCIYPRPQQIVAPMESTMWFDAELLLSSCKVHQKMDERDLTELIFEKHNPFGVPLTFVPGEDVRNRGNFKYIPEEEREFIDTINGIILPSMKGKKAKTMLPDFKAMNVENLPVLKKQDLFRKKLEADISLLTNATRSPPPLSIDPVDMLVKKGRAMIEVIGTCDFEKPIFPRRSGLQIKDYIPEFSKSSTLLPTDDTIEEVRKLRLFRRHEQTWWSKEVQEMMARCGHLPQLQSQGNEKYEIPAEKEMDEFYDDELTQLQIDLDERAVNDLQTIGAFIQDYLLQQDSENEEEDGVVVSTGELLALGFKLFPPAIGEAGIIIREHDNDVFRETNELMGMQQLQDVRNYGDETMSDDDGLQDILDIF